MSKFSLKKPIKLIIRGASTSVIPNPQGIPVAVSNPAKTIEIKAGVYETDDVEIIERIRRDVHFNTPDGIIEITEEEQEAIKIREKKLKEAEEEIKERKRGRPKGS